MAHHRLACTTRACHHLRSHLATRCSCLDHRQDIPITTQACIHITTRCTTIQWVYPIRTTLVVIIRDTSTE